MFLFQIIHTPNLIPDLRWIIWSSEKCRKRIVDSIPNSDLNYWEQLKGIVKNQTNSS